MVSNSMGIRRVNTDKRIFLIALTLYVINAFSTQVNVIGISLGFAQLFYLFFLLIRGKLDRYILCLILFLTTTIEIAQFATGEIGSNIYNFTSLPVVRGYHFNLIILLPFVLIIREKKLKLFLSELSKYKEIKFLVKYLGIFLYLGVVMSLTALLFNDNNVANSSSFWIYSRREFLAFLSIFSLIFQVSYLLIIRKDFKHELELYLISSLLAFLPSAIIVTLLNLFGYYGSQKVLLMPLAGFFLSLLIIFPFYKRYNKKKVYFLLGVLSTILLLMYPSPLGGKWWFVVASIPLLIVYRSLKSTNLVCKVVSYGCTIMVLFIGILIGMTGINSVESNFEFQNNLTQNKYIQARMALYFWKDGWYENMPTSPKFRIEESVNIFWEYVEKPYFLVTGKGFGGSIINHTDVLNWNNTGAFPSIQIQENIFIGVHESFNVLFLKFGLMGLYFFLKIVLFCFKKFKYNPWAVLGLFWFVFFINVYSTLYFGLASLLLGLYNEQFATSKKSLKYLESR